MNTRSSWRLKRDAVRFGDASIRAEEKSSWQVGTLPEMLVLPPPQMLQKGWSLAADVDRIAAMMTEVENLIMIARDLWIQLKMLKG